MSAGPDIPLADGFAAPDRAEWEELATRALRGRRVEETLATDTPEGVTLKLLYRADDLTPGAAAARAAIPCPDDRDRWDIRQLHCHPDPSQGNADIRADVEGGAHAVLLGLDSGARRGEAAERGGDGIVLRSPEDWLVLFHGVDLAAIAIGLRAGASTPAAAAQLLACADRQGVPPSSLTGSLGADPLTGLARDGRLPEPVADQLEATCELARWCANHLPGMRAIEIDTSAYHAAGATETQDIAFAVATGVAYLRALTDAGMSVDDAARQVGFCLSVGTDVFQAIAKLRALRRIWARVIEASGGGTQARITTLAATTAARMMSRRDAWVNALRATAGCLAAAVGGADSVTVLPYSHALGVPEARARRIARNTQTILMRESGLARVADPAGGSYFAERLTSDYAEQAWSLFQDLERSGGMARALAEGRVTTLLEQAWEQRLGALARGSDVVTGVSRFPDLDEAAVPLAEVAAPAPVSATLRHGLPEGRGPEALVRAAAAGADLTALLTPFRGEPAIMTAVNQHRLGEAFEALRDASDRWQVRRGRRPTALLVQLGTPAEYTERSVFAKSYLATAGIGAIEVPVEVAEQAGNTLAAHDVDLVVLCSSDTVYATSAAGAASGLKASGAARVLLAGRPGKDGAALRSSGVDVFIHAGDDMLATLTRLATDLGMTLP